MGQARGILQGTDQQFLLSANFPNPAILDQRVGYIPKCRLNSLLILSERVLALCLLEVDIRLQSTGGKDRLCNLRNEGPGSTRTAKQIRQGITLKSKGSRQTDRGEICCLCSCD